MAIKPIGYTAGNKLTLADDASGLSGLSAASGLTGQVPQANGGLGVDASALSNGVLVKSGGAMSSTTAPTMSGANISSATIPTSSLDAATQNRLNPTPSTAGRIAYDTGTGYSSATAGTATQVLHGGTAPSFSAVALATDVSGTLAAANGGTGNASYTAGDLLYASGTTALSKLTAGAANTLLQSNGAAAPSWTSAPTVSGTNITNATIRLDSLVSQGTSLNAILRWNGTNWGISASPSANFLLTSGASAPTWSNILNGIIFDANVNTLSNIATSMLASGFNLAATQGGTGQTAYSVGDILYASTTTALSKLAASTSGYVLTAAGASTAPAWAAPITNTTGASSLSSNYNVTGSYANVGLSVSLPSTGKYRVWGEVRCQLQVSVSTGNITIRLYDSTAAAAISNSERISVFSQSSVLAGSTVPIGEVIQVTGASTIDVQAITAAGPTYTSAQILSDSSGRSRLFYEKIGP